MTMDTQGLDKLHTISSFIQRVAKYLPTPRISIGNNSVEYIDLK